MRVIQETVDRFWHPAAVAKGRWCVTNVLDARRWPGELKLVFRRAGANGPLVGGRLAANDDDPFLIVLLQRTGNCSWSILSRAHTRWRRSNCSGALWPHHKTWKKNKEIPPNNIKTNKTNKRKNISSVMCHLGKWSWAATKVLAEIAVFY